MKHLPIHLLLLAMLSLVGLASCEYPLSDNHYVEIEKPAENIPMEISFEGLQDGGEIHIYGNTKLYFNINTENRPIVRINAMAGNSHLSVSEDPKGYYLYLPYDSYHYQDKQLKINIAVSSNSGSLAEKLLMELYEGEFTFTIKSFPMTNIELNIREEVTENKQLKLVWDLSASNTPQIDYVMLYSYSSIDYTYKRIEGSQNYYIDTDYFFGSPFYRFEFHFKEEGVQPYSFYYDLKEPNAVRNLTFEDVDANKMKASWEGHKYACKYLILGDHGVSIETNTNSAIVDRGIFPDYQYYMIYAIHPDTKEEDYINRRAYVGSYFCEYSSLSTTINAFSIKNKQGVSIKQSWENNYIPFVYYYDLDKMTLVKSEGLHYQPSYNSWTYFEELNKVVLWDDKNLFIYNEGDHKNFQIVNMGLTTFTYIGDVKLIGEELGVITLDNNGYKLTTVDAESGEITSTKSFPDMNTSNFTISNDGKYLIIMDINQYQLYDMQDTDSDDYKLLFTKSLSTSHGSEAFFDPADSNRLIICNGSVSSIFYYLDIEKQSIVKEMNGKYLNTDPFTGNVCALLRDENNFQNYINVYSPDLSKVLLTLNIGGTDLQLINNYLISYNGSYFKLFN